jgi:bifunctional DNA-binding transcriptional regulator/antitoxin component of YhaV-PrlF toxin-antitoxin module
MNQQLRIKVSGDLEGDFVVIEARSEDEFVIARESSLPSLGTIRERSGAHPATAQEFAAFEGENGPFLPPDGEG